jgi:hypothetical protein
LLGASVASAQDYAGKLGVEAAGDAFIDVVRQSYRWTDPNGRALAAEDVDEYGWPLGDCSWILDFRPVAEWTGAIDDPEVYRVDHSGTYKGSFLGSAILVAAGGNFTLSNQAYDQASNTTSFDLVIPEPGPHHGLVILEFQQTRRTPGAKTNSGLTDFRLLRPGYPRNTMRLFTDSYMACLRSANFSAIRFMGVLETNGNVEWGLDGTRTQTWKHRKRPEDAGAGRMDAINKKDGWPWDHVIALCNQVDMDPWINIPVSVDDQYIRELARLFRDGLEPERSIYIEHSNELWNWGFKQYAWNKARAVEDVTAGRADYDYDHSDNPEFWGQRRHAQRLKDSVAIFADVLGREEINNRIRGVLAGRSAATNDHFICGRVPGMLKYLRATGSEPKDWIYAISIPLYYGGPAAEAKEGTEAASVDEIIKSMRKHVLGLRPKRRAAIDLARAYDLPGGVCSYEGGPSLGVGKTDNVANRIRAVRDVRQKEIYKLNFADCFWELGGNMAMQFTLAGPYTRYGAWGLTDDLSDPNRNALFQAVRELVGP